MNLLLLEPDEVLPDGVARVSGTRAAHLRNVLKVAPGQPIRVGVVDGPAGTAHVETMSDASVDLRCSFSGPTPERPIVDVLLALPRPKVMRRLWAQLAALGVGRIVLTNAARVERDYFDTHSLTPDTWRPLLLEGLQQARDTRLPLVSIHRRFRVLVEDELDALCGPATRIVADPAAATAPADVLANRVDQRVMLAIGPEGGWNPFELALLAARGFRAIGIGPRTLRSDTAAVALLAVVHDVLRTAGVEARG